MIRLLTILLLASLAANAQTTYYVSASGNDANDGLTTSTAWQTLLKVNAAIADGDAVLLNGGNSWNEQLYPKNNNTFDSYGTGKAILSGFQSVTSWTNVSPNKWYAIIPNAPAKLNTVTRNGSLLIKATDSTQKTFNTASSNDSILVASGIGISDLSGREIAIRWRNWITDVTVLTSKVNNTTYNISPKLTYPTSTGETNKFWFQNDTAYLNSANEFVWRGDTLYVFSSASPTNVQVSVIDTLVKINQKTNVSISNISFIGANQAGVLIDTSSYTSVLYSSFNNMGIDAIRIHKTNHATVDHDSIQNILNDAVYLGNKPVGSICMDDTTNNFVFTNNYLKNIAIYNGMAASYNGAAIGVRGAGDSSLIDLNTFENVGYIPINYVGRGTKITRNYIKNFCSTKTDGAGIDTYIGSGVCYIPTYTNGMIIEDNTIINDVPVVTGSYAKGIYLDQNTNGVAVRRNTTNAGFFCHQCYNNSIKHNLFGDSTGNSLELLGTASELAGNTFIGNILNQRSSSLYASKFSSANVSQISDSNTYIRALKPDSLINNTGIYSFDNFRLARGLDMHGKGQPLYIGTQSFLFINPTASDSTLVLTQNLTGVNGNFYIKGSTITLAPFGSKLMFDSQRKFSSPAYLTMY